MNAHERELFIPPMEAKVYRIKVAALLCNIGLLLAITSDANAQASKPSAVTCDAIARNYAQNGSRQGQMLRGVAGGSLLGAGIGAIAGGAGVGAAVGAGIGLIGGGARRHATADRMYNAAYQDCMAGRIR